MRRYRVDVFGTTNEKSDWSVTQDRTWERFYIEAADRKEAIEKAETRFGTRNPDATEWQARTVKEL